MTAFDDRDRTIATWLDQAATAPVPDYLGDALARVDRTGQRGRGVSWPASMPNPFLRRTAVLVAVGALLLALVGLALLAGSTRQPTPIPLPKLGLLVISRDGTIRVAQADGSDARRISPDVMQLRGPRWSTDGTRIAAWGSLHPSTGSIHPGEVWVMDRDGGGIRSITATLDPLFVDGLAWSPDDRRIASAGQGRLIVADTDGVQAVEIEATLLQTDMPQTVPMSWSPDSNELAIVMARAGSDREGALALVDVHTGDVTVVPTVAPLGPTSLDTASWSPAGDAIAYVATNWRDGGRWMVQDLMVTRRNEGSWTESMLVRGLEPAPSVTGTPIPRLFGWPAWSNDGTRLAWFQWALGEPPALWVGAADGSAPRMLAELPVSGIDALGAPAWLPDDSRIAVPNVPESEPSLLLVDPDGVAPAVSLAYLGGDWQGVAP